MLDIRTWSASLAVLACALLPCAAAAQDGSAGLMALGKGELRDEISRRYDEALARTGDAAVVAEDSTAFMWASQAKAQCGIALGFLKSGTKDPVSVGKCDDAYNRMSNAPLPVVPAPALPVAQAEPCGGQPSVVFFDWNSAALGPESASTLDATVSEAGRCGSAAIRVAGYSDRSGSDRYNLRLSGQRAEAVRAYLVSRGVTAPVTTQAFGEANPRVPTEDGVREIQNRRVEITVE